MAVLRLLDGVDANTLGPDKLVGDDGGVNLVITGNLGGGTISVYEKSYEGQAKPLTPVYSRADALPQRLHVKRDSYICAELSGATNPTNVELHAVSE